MLPNEEQHSTRPRRSRRKKSESTIGEAAGEGWAVSYSDLLMVLMSFFIIFYNTDDSKGGKEGVESLLRKLRLDEMSIEVDPKTGKVVHVEVKKAENLIEGFSEGTLSVKNEENSITRRTSSYLGGDKKRKVRNTAEETPVALGEGLGKIYGITFHKIDPKVNKNDKSRWNKVLKSTNDKSVYKGGLVIDFSDDLYNLGNFELTDKATKEMMKVLSLIKPYEEKLNIVFIGHSDSVPIKGDKKIINSNLILSSLRAAKAVEYAVNFGMNPMWVSSQGLSKFTRNTRSLSIRIMER